MKLTETVTNGGTTTTREYVATMFDDIKAMRDYVRGAVTQPAAEPPKPHAVWTVLEGAERDKALAQAKAMMAKPKKAPAKRKRA